MTSQNKAFLCAGGTVLAWSTVSTAFKMALQGMTPMQLLFVSTFTATVFLGALLLLQGGLAQVKGFSRRDWREVAMLGLLVYAYYSLLFVAYDRLPAQVTQPVNMTWAIMLALISAKRQKQPQGLKELSFMLLAYSGVVVIAAGGGKTFGTMDFTGLLCVISSTVIYALYWILNSTSKLPATLALGLSFAITAALSGATLAVTGQSFITPAYWPAIYVGLFEFAVPFVLWGLALRLTSTVSRITSLTFLVPFFALFWINLIIKEPIALSTVLGLVLIVTGTILQQRASRPIE